MNLCIVLTICACGKTELYNPDKYLGENQKDSTLVDIIQYSAPIPEYSKEPKGAPTLRPYFGERLSFYSLQYYYPGKDSMHYFLIFQKAPSTSGERIGIGGYYKKNQNKMHDFIEVFQTPKMDPEILREKGGILFNELVRKGNVDAYLKDKTYIEFPDEKVYYDKSSKEWKTK